MKESLLAVRDLSIHFGGLKAVDGVDFHLDPGEILGLLGPNGAGKTTCFNMISGVYRPTRGGIRFQGARTDGLAPHQMAALGYGLRCYKTDLRPFLRRSCQSQSQSVPLRLSSALPQIPISLKPLAVKPR